MAGGVLYLIRKDLTSIWTTFQTDGPIAAIGELFSTIFTRLNDLRKEWHIDAKFFTDVFGVVKGYAVQAYHFVKKEFLGPLYDYLETEGIFYFEKFFALAANSAKRMLAKELSFGDASGDWMDRKAAGMSNKLLGSLGLLTETKGRDRTQIQADQGVAFRKTMRQQDYANAQLAAQTARAQFDSNAAVVKITKEASGVIKALSPVTKQAGDMFSSITNYLETTASDAWAEALAPALQKGAAEMQLAVDVHIDGEKLDSRIGRATRTNLAGAGRSAVLDGN